MITLITGTPGSGKTLYALTELYPSFESRKVFIDGIPELQLDHEVPLGPIEGQKHYSEWLPDGAVLIVDEAQRIWSPRASSAPVPPGVRAMETHRHHGHDLVFITQHPNLLDQNIRRLVGRHLHVRRVWGWKRSVIYEWDQATDPNRTKTAITKTWSYPTSAFGTYKSASIHTARGQRPPWYAWMLLILPLILGYFIWSAYSSVKARTAPQQVAVAGAPGERGTATTPGAPAAAPTTAPDFIPRQSDRPDTAPIYDGLRSQVMAVPRLTGCVSSLRRCTCYTLQATVYPMPDKDCRDIARDGVFDPYANPHTPSVTTQQAVAPPGQSEDTI